MKRTLSLPCMLMVSTMVTVGAMCGFASAQETKPATPTPPPAPAAQPATTPVKAEPKPAEKPAQPAEKPAEKKDNAMEKLVHVKMQTSMGDIFLELNREKAPLSVENVMKYVDNKFYDGTIFHRVISKFMIQGGGFTEDMKQKPTERPIKNEWQNGLKNLRGSLAMARTPVADSATSQFFINVVDNGFLDQPRDGAGYAVFGRVVNGMDVVDKIGDVKTGVKVGTQDVPLTTVKIIKMERISAEEAMKGSTGDTKK